MSVAPLLTLLLPQGLVYGTFSYTDAVGMLPGLATPLRTTTFYRPGRSAATPLSESVYQTYFALDGMPLSWIVEYDESPQRVFAVFDEDGPIHMFACHDDTIVHCLWGSALNVDKAGRLLRGLRDWYADAHPSRTALKGSFRNARDALAWHR